MPDILIRGMCKLESGKSYRALFKELNGKFVVVVELVESYADREVEIYPVEELPQHGDLIDRRELLSTVMQVVTRFPTSNIAAIEHLDLVSALLRGATVVVPAERSEP